MKLFKKYIDKEVQKLLPKIREEVKAELENAAIKDWKENCDFIFEHEGHSYFKYKDHRVIPLQRLELIHCTENLLDSRLNNTELNHLIDIAEASLEKAFNSVKQSNRIEGVNTALWATQEMKKRKERLMFHPTLLIELAAYTIIRDDEKPEEVNMAIHEQKIKLFKTKGGEIPFLLQGNIGTALIKPEKYLKNITALWELTQSEVEYEEQAYKKILLGLSSKTTVKDSETI